MVRSTARGQVALVTLLGGLCRGCLAALCDAEWQAKECPVYCTGVLQGKCCTKNGKQASILTVPSPSHARAIQSRTEWYKNCTGANIQTPLYTAQCIGSGSQFCGGFRALFEIGMGAVDDAKGAGIYDGYMTQAMDLADFGDAIEDLSPRIRNSLELDWSDILPYVQKMNMVGNEQKALPFDFDFINIIIREDLRHQYANETDKAAPQTWEQFAEWVEYWYGKDLNRDGETDYGICSLNGAGPGGPQAMLMAIAAAKLQYEGASQGMWFETSTKTATPLFDNPGFKQALELTRRMWMVSLDRNAGDWVYLHDTAWLTGRCSAYMWLTGSVSYVLTTSPIERRGPDGTLLWQPTGPHANYIEPRRVMPMGSKEVYDRKSKSMKKCNPETPPPEGHVTCPFLDQVADNQDGDWINRVPYYYSAYQHSSISLRKTASEEHKELLWDFLVFANVNAAAVVAQKEGSTYLDPFRRSQIAPEAKPLYGSAWSEQMYNDMRQVYLWAGTTPNAALPLSIPGREAYEYAMERYLWQYFLDVAPCANHIECKCKKWIGGRVNNPDCGYGWGTAPDTALWARADAEGKGSITTDEFVSKLSKEYDRITEQFAGPGAEGKLKQTNLYRQTIGLEPFERMSDGDHGDHGDRTDGVLILLFASILGAMILVIICYGSYRSYITFKAALVAKRKQEKAIEERIMNATKGTKACLFNMCFVKLSQFKSYGKLVSHEVARELGHLVSLDKYEDVCKFVLTHATVFISHQWLAFTEPDPDQKHYAAICCACEMLCKMYSLQDGEIYLWVDYISIPQRNNFLKQLSINSLATYASVARFFLIIAPECTHHNWQIYCNSETYQRRGWCRLEQWARMTVGGLNNMFLYEGASSALVPLIDKPNWYETGVLVFEGDFTDEADKPKIVDIVLGLWAQALTNENATCNEFLAQIVQRKKNQVFPTCYFDGLVEKLEKFIANGEGIEPVKHSTSYNEVLGEVASYKYSRGATDVKERSSTIV
jgi:hypothetical protein